jgi:hypothetical protein
VDVDELARRVRVGVNGSATSLDMALGDEFSDQVAIFRSHSVGRFRGEIVERVRDVQSDAIVTMHVSANHWATGSFPGSFDDESFSGVATVVANCWEGATGEWELQRLRALVSDRRRVGAYLRLDRGWDDGSQIVNTVSRYVRSGMDEMHLYHLGLVTQSGLDVGRRLIEASAAHASDHWTRANTPAWQEERLR